MKTFRLAFPSLLLGALLPLGAFAQTNPGGPVAAVAKPEAKWTQSDTPELREALMQLERFSADPAMRQERQLAQMRIETLARARPWRLNVSFPGGPLNKALELIARPNGEAPINILGSDGPANLSVDLPAFILRNADLRTVFGVIQTFLELRGYALIPAGDLGNPEAIVAVLHRREGAAHSSDTELETLQLTDYLFENQTVESITDAIRFAWALDPARDPKALKIQVHPPTKMLLVSGPSPAGAVAQKVLTGLRKKPAAK